MDLMETGNRLSEQVPDPGGPSTSTSRFPQGHSCNFCEGTFTSELGLLLHFRKAHYLNQEGLSSSDESEEDEVDDGDSSSPEEGEAGGEGDLMNFLTECERAHLLAAEQEPVPESEGEGDEDLDLELEEEEADDVPVPETEGEGDGDDDLEQELEEEEADDIQIELGNDKVSISRSTGDQTPEGVGEGGEDNPSYSLRSGNLNGLTLKTRAIVDKKRPQRAKSKVLPKVQLIWKKAKPKCPHCSFIAIDNHKLGRHMKVHDARGKDFKCSKCNSYFAARSALVSHERALHGNGKKILKESMTERELAEQFIIQRDIEVVRSTDKDTKKPKKLFKCKLCGTLCRTAWHARSHIRLVHWKQKPFKCGHCSKSFGRNYDLKVHRITVHGADNGDPDRPESGNRSEDNEDDDGDKSESEGDSSSEKEEGTGNGGGVEDDPDSPLLLEEEESDNDNMEEVDNEDFSCEGDQATVIDEGAPTRSGNYRRTRSNNGATKSTKVRVLGQNSCPHCSYSPAHRRELDRHMEVHNKQGKNFKCSKCDSYFVARNALVSHVRSLHGKTAKESKDLLKVQKCIEIVPASASTKTKHKSGTQYKCKLCGKLSARAGNAYSHVRIVHWKELPYKCEQCSKSFGMNRKLKLHRLHCLQDRVMRSECNEK